MHLLPIRILKQMDMHNKKVYRLWWISSKQH